MLIYSVVGQFNLVTEAHNGTTKHKTAHSSVRHAAAQLRGGRSKAYLLQGVKGERNGKKKGRTT